MRSYAAASRTHLRGTSALVRNLVALTTLQVQVVPERTTALLLASGLGILGAQGRRR